MNLVVPNKIRLSALLKQIVVLLWTLDPTDRDAFLANEATRKWKATNQVLLEIACTRTSNELLSARQAYHARFKRSLEEDVAYHTTGDFRKVYHPLRLL
uniref:Uncharacterized protein n=1 Tax=Nelumbo nucifera TaxID=4432 RepID=A0A822Z985_NELNU|nr:TPA_asm: hypothetical protein HUJ06_015473 [Nelumbo nucifera]